MSSYEGSRQPDYLQNIKQFQTSQQPINSTWTYNSSGQLTPSDQSKNVYIPNNLYTEKLYIKGVYTESDFRLKHNIDTLDMTTFDPLFKLDPKQYTFISDKSNRLHYGLIAQDLEQYYPELVDTSDENIKSVNYIELIPLLMGKMKKMQLEIDNLKDMMSKKI